MRLTLKKVLCCCADLECAAFFEEWGSTSVSNLRTSSRRSCALLRARKFSTETLKRSTSFWKLFVSGFSNR